jgi:hypothetical protein
VQTRQTRLYSDLLGCPTHRYLSRRLQLYKYVNYYTTVRQLQHIILLDFSLVKSEKLALERVLLAQQRDTWSEKV